MPAAHTLPQHIASDMVQNAVSCWSCCPGGAHKSHLRSADVLRIACLTIPTDCLDWALSWLYSTLGTVACHARKAHSSNGVSACMAASWRAPFMLAYLGAVERLWRVDARRDYHHIVAALPEAFDEIAEADFHAWTRTKID